MEQMMTGLLAEMRTNREEVRTNQEKKEANVTEMEAGQELLKEEMRFKMETNQGKMMAKLDVHHEK
jgi:hypothetical protein